jgi:hypothetical protein
MENIMNKISKTAVNTYNAASKATSKIAKEIKLKTQMAEYKGKIQELYEDIGKTVYEKYVLNEEINIETDLNNNCTLIDELAKNVEDIRMEILKLKDLKQCPNCHYEIYFDFHYCPNCGQTQNEENKQEEKQNDGPATIVTTDNEDMKLKKHIEPKDIDEQIYEEEEKEEFEEWQEIDVYEDE